MLTTQEQLWEAKAFIERQKETIKRYEKVMCLMLKFACDEDADILIDIITDAFNGFDLMEQYEEEALEGTNILAQFLEDK